MIDRRTLLSSLALFPALQPQTAVAQQTRRNGNSAFSFAVYGDSRSMMYLPYKSDQREEAIKLMVDMFELVLPEKVAEEIVRRDVKLTYDPSTDELVQIVMPFETKSEVSTLTLDKGLSRSANHLSLYFFQITVPTALMPLLKPAYSTGMQVADTSRNFGPSPVTAFNDAESFSH